MAKKKQTVKQEQEESILWLVIPLSLLILLLSYVVYNCIFPHPGLKVGACYAHNEATYIARIDYVNSYTVDYSYVGLKEFPQSKVRTLDDFEEIYDKEVPCLEYEQLLDINMALSNLRARLDELESRKGKK